MSRRKHSALWTALQMLFARPEKHDSIRIIVPQNESTDIKAGDLVLVTRWTCCNAGLGGVFQVDSIAHSSGGDCRHCGAQGVIPNNPELAVPFAMTSGIVVPCRWLKKLPPPGIEESTDTETTKDERAVA